jgi:hypothetical protein
MGFICHHFLAVVVQTWVLSKDTIFGFSVPHREKLCAIVRVKKHLFQEISKNQLKLVIQEQWRICGIKRDMFRKTTSLVNVDCNWVCFNLYW